MTESSSSPRSRKPVPEAERQIRVQVGAMLRRVYEESPFPTQAELARALHYGEGYVTNLLKGNKDRQSEAAIRHFVHVCMPDDPQAATRTIDEILTVLRHQPSSHVEPSTTTHQETTMSTETTGPVGSPEPPEPPLGASEPTSNIPPAPGPAGAGIPGPRSAYNDPNQGAFTPGYPWPPTMPVPPAQPVPDQNGPYGGLITGGFVCAVIGLVLAFIPGVGLLGSPLLIIGLVLCVIALVRAENVRRGMSIAGLACALAGLLIAIVVNVVAFAGDSSTGTDGGAIAAPPSSEAPATSSYTFTAEDQAYLNTLAGRGVNIGSDQKAVIVGHQMCDYMNLGNSPAETQQLLVSKGYDAYEALVITGASLGAYCN